jgi:hypothetical protein
LLVEVLADVEAEAAPVVLLEADVDALTDSLVCAEALVEIDSETESEAEPLSDLCLEVDCDSLLD